MDPKTYLGPQVGFKMRITGFGDYRVEGLQGLGIRV